MINQIIKLFLTMGLIMTFSRCASGPNKDCEKLKRGTFRQITRLPKETLSFLITRNDSVQTEIEESSGKSAKLSIKWTDDCTYELRQLESDFQFSDSMEEVGANLLKNEILSRTDEYYIYRSEREGIDFVVTDTMWILKK